VARIRDKNVKAGTEENFSEEAGEYLSNIQQSSAGSHAAKPSADQGLYTLEAEQKLQPLRLGIIKMSKDLVVGKSLRVLNQQVDAFVGLGTRGSEINEIEYEFTNLRTRMEQMVQDGVMDNPSAVEIQNQAIVEVMGARSRYLRDFLGASAEDLVAVESKRLQKYLQPVYERKAAAARRLGEKEWKTEQERQIVEQVRAFNIPWEEARRMGVEAGVDIGHIESAYSEHHNRLYTQHERQEKSDDQALTKSSRAMRAEFIITAVKDKKFDLFKAVEQNKRNLTPEDAEAMVDYYRALTKSRKEPDVSDPGVLFSLIKHIGEDPSSPLLDKALAHSREQGLLARGDFEQWTARLYDRRRELENKDTERRKSIYTEEQASMRNRLKVVSETQDIDPIAQEVTNKYEEILRGAMWGPELNINDKVRFEADPRGFSNEMKLKGRLELEDRLAAEAIRMLELFPQFLDENGQIRPGIGAQAYKERAISLVDAKRLELLESLQRRGRIPDWPFKPQPVPPAPPKPEKSFKQKFLEFFGSESSGTEERKPTKEKQFK